MGIMDSLRKVFGGEIQSLNLEPRDMKKAWQAQSIGVTGRAEPLTVDRYALNNWSRRNELVYACIEKKKQAAIDPTPVVEKMLGDAWEKVPGHPLSRLLMRPNPIETGPDFWGNWLACEDIFGECYAEIERNAIGQPVRLWRLNPLYMRPVAGRGKDGSPIKSYEFTYQGKVTPLRAEDVLVRRKADPTNVFFGLSPLEVGLNAIDMDTAQTEFVRAFFNNGGVPSGILKYTDGRLTEEQAEYVRQRFVAKYGRGGRGQGGVAVLDERIEYQQVGSKLAEIESDALRCHAESRICTVFGVPPILVGAYVGLLHVNQRASVAEAQNDFWINTMSPLFKSLRIWLTWNLLPEFANIALIESEKVRVNWDMSQVMALQEDLDQRQDRARKNFQAGGISFNEFREAIGEAADPKGDFFVRPLNTVVYVPENALTEAEMPPQEPLQLTGETIDAEIVEDEEKGLRVKFDKPDGVAVADLNLLKKLADPQVKAPEGKEFAWYKLQKELIAQAIAEVETASEPVFSLVPPSKAYSTLRDETVASIVSEVQEKAMFLLSSLTIEGLQGDEFKRKFAEGMYK